MAAPQPVAVQLYYGAAWHDLTSADDVLAEAPIVITRGQGDASPALRPSSVSLRLSNIDDQYRLSNPLSPLYGNVGRNAPLRILHSGTQRAVVQASSWKSAQSADFRRTPARGNAWTDVLGGGVSEQVNRWTEKLRSALYRSVQFSGVTPAEWWPMEDASGSATAAAASPNGQPMTPVTAVRYYTAGGVPVPPGGAPDFARGAGVPGSDPLPSFQQGGTLAAPVRTAAFDGYAVDWVMQFQAGTDEGGTSSADVLSWRETGTYVHFTVNVTKGYVTVLHATVTDDATGAATGSASAAFDVYDGAPHHFRYQVRQDSGNYLAQLYIDGTLWATADNFVPGMAGTVGAPTRVEWNPLEARGDYMPIAAGHLIVWPSGQLGAQPPVFSALTGYDTERSAYRLSRLCAEQGITCYFTPGYPSSSPMGPQRSDTLANLLTEITSTEDGLLFDYADAPVLVFVSRVDRYNQAVTLDLVPTDLPFLPMDATDAQGLGNVITAAQRAGGDATARDDDGPNGTVAQGEYQKRVDVNIYNEANLPQYANWWLRRLSVDVPRFPQVTIDLLPLSAAKRAAVEAVGIGDVVTITGFREDVIRLHVLGSVETITNHSRMIVLNCAADQQFQVATYDDAYRRYESRTSTLNADATSTATSLIVTFDAAGDAWSTTSCPYDWKVSGERITVTAMGAVAGAGPYTQTATVTRSVNGIIKALHAGDNVRMHPDQEARYAL